MAKDLSIYWHQCAEAVHIVLYFDTWRTDKSLEVEGVLSGFELGHQHIHMSLMLICEGCGDIESFGNLCMAVILEVLNGERFHSLALQLHYWLGVKHPPFFEVQLSVFHCFDVYFSFPSLYPGNYSLPVEVPRPVSYRAFEGGKHNGSVSHLTW